MKKLGVLVLAIALAFALCACGDPYEKACKLLDEGKYDEAITALEQLEKTDLVEMKLSQAKDAKYRVEYADYFGEWVSGGQDFTITLNEDKTGTTNRFPASFCFEYEEDGIRITMPEEARIQLDSFCGVPSLIAGNVRFFRADVIPKITETIEITKENFLEYFEATPLYAFYVDVSPYDYPSVFLAFDYQINKNYIEKYVPCVLTGVTATVGGNYIYHNASWNGNGFDIETVGKEYKNFETCEFQSLWECYPSLFDQSIEFSQPHYYLETKEPYIPSSYLRLWGTSRSYQTNDTSKNFDLAYVNPTDVIEATGTLLLYKEAPQS